MIGPYRARSNRLFNKNDFVFDNACALWLPPRCPVHRLSVTWPPRRLSDGPTLLFCGLTVVGVGAVLAQEVFVLDALGCGGPWD